MESLSYDALKNETLLHDNKKIVQHILICKFSKDQNKINENKILLFRRLSFIVVKQVNNFFYLLRNNDREIFHTKDEIVCECFLVLDRCIRGCNWKQNKTNFYFYYNKSLTRELYRLFQKTYLKHCSCITYEDKHNCMNICEQKQEGLFDFYYETMGLTSDEKKIIDSKLMKQKMKEFVKSTKGMNSKKYKELSQSITKKVLLLKDRENQQFFR